VATVVRKLVVDDTILEVVDKEVVEAIVDDLDGIIALPLT